MISSIKLEHIYKQYTPAQFTLNIGNLEFRNKHIHIIVGPNGSGKSTILNLLSFLDSPDQGNILVDGKLVFSNNNSKNGLRKKIGFVRQSPYLFNTNVFENVALGLKIRRRSRDEIVSKVNDILATLKIQHLTERNVKSLSRGEYQKVAIAQVLVLEPEIILLDEPTANIDDQSILSIEEAVKNIQNRFNPIIIMTTHLLSQAYRISPDIISIREGRIVDFVHENVFFGEIKDSVGGLQSMKVSEGIEITLSTEKKGKGYIAIDPKDIIISKDVVKTSARNTFSGKIIGIKSLSPNIQVLIDIGTQISSIITKQSFEEMDINLGSTICVSFKVNSVKVI